MNLNFLPHMGWGFWMVRQTGFLEEQVDHYNPAIDGSLAPAIDTMRIARIALLFALVVPPAATQENAQD